MLLVFDWIEPPAGVDKKTTGDALSIVMSDDIKYRNDYYGLLAVWFRKKIQKVTVQSTT